MDEKIYYIPDMLAGNDPVSLLPTQTWLAPYVDILIVLWWTVWLTVIVILATYYIIIPTLRDLKKTNQHYGRKP
ncbi:MAG: hypothetical protein KC877_01415 [Candidatus Kaiserbacteria bacterium]|nr:hypothetical protein [Candidatus Kaiserbacteria bacterium]MCB9816666.1 hypothetical protein [Candidatus Nomurabacteria bacterium]